MTAPLTTDAFVPAARAFLGRVGYTAARVASDFRFSYPLGSAFGSFAPSLVAFSAAPHSMRTACIAVADIGGANVEDTLGTLRFLSAPIAIIKREQSVQLWSVRERIATAPIAESTPELWKEDFTRLSDLSPDALSRAKSGQLSLPSVDSNLHSWASAVTSRTLTQLLSDLLADAHAAKSRSVKENEIIHLVFQLFAARVIQDKGLLPETAKPSSALKSASELFPNCFAAGIAPPLRDIAAACYESLCGYSFSGVDSEMLGHAYENTLVTPAFRKATGVYYTPRSIASYILNSLPIESIPQSDRRLGDPCCGSGSFLLAGFERLNALLPSDWTISKRHTYLRDRIFGSDKDAFAVDVARLSLILADPTSRDGWQVSEVDALSLDEKTYPKRPTIIVTNPPFKELKKGSRQELAAEILIRAIAASEENALIGAVLPLSVLESQAAFNLRRIALHECDFLEVSLFPGGMFYSAAETCVWLLRKRDPARRLKTCVVRELKSADIQNFNRGEFTRTYPASSEAWRANPENALIFSPLLDVVKRVENEARFRLGEVATVNAGLQIYKTDIERVSETQRRGDRRFVSRLEALRPFAFLCENDIHPCSWIRYEAKALRRTGSEVMYKNPKVLINSNRNPGSTWRIVAAIARREVFFSDNFHGIQAKHSDIPLEHIAAVLNSHVANAWLDAHSRKRKLVIRTLERIPWPQFSDRAGSTLVSLVRDLEKAVSAEWAKADAGLFYEREASTADAAMLLQSIDDIVFDAYGIAAGEERSRIESIMSSDKRPG